MPSTKKHRLSLKWVLSVLVVFFAGFTLLLKILLDGKNIAVLNPKGLVAQEQLGLMIISLIILLAVTVPVVFVLYFVAYKYRETNTKASYKPNRQYGKKFTFIIWTIPSVFMVILAFVMLPATQRLAPQKAIAADNPQLTIQVVSLRWKWVFIYPDQQIATVNYVQIPVNTPVHFELTADDAPMSSFWIPNLAGQLYTMTGHVNNLNMIANTPGDYTGSTSELNGEGFAGMKFTARVGSNTDFYNWVQIAKQSPTVLDANEYESLVRPSENVSPAVYSAYENGLYDTVLSKYAPPGEGHNHHE